MYERAAFYKGCKQRTINFHQMSNGEVVMLQKYNVLRCPKESDRPFGIALQGMWIHNSYHVRLITYHNGPTFNPPLTQVKVSPPLLGEGLGERFFITSIKRELDIIIHNS